MRLNHDRNRMNFRRQSPRLSGCLSMTMVILMLVGVGWVGQDWIRAWLYQWVQPTQLDYNLQDGHNAFARGNLDRAIAAAQQQYQRNPDDVEALVLLARAMVYRSYEDYNHERDRLDALQLTGEAAERLPLNWNAQAIYAYVQQTNNINDEARRISLRVIRQDQQNIIARVTLAMVYNSQGLFEAAEREANIAITIANTQANDWRADAYRALGFAQRSTAKYTEAAAAWEQAIEHHRRLIPLHFERASVALSVGDNDTATAYYFNIVAFDDANVKARLRLCEVSSKLAERQAAIDYCTKVTELAPGWAEGWYHLGREYYLKGDWQQARQTLGRCSSLQVAQNIPIVERRLECWYIQGQAAEVLRDCPTLLRLYDEFQHMAANADIAQTWSYPPGGPAICTPPLTVPRG